MPRRKPQGWPRYMVTRRLAGGSIHYYWVAPTWAVEGGWSMGSEALGADYGDAKRRCDDVLNLQFDAWRTRNEVPSPTARVPIGTFDWMVQVYKSSPKYRDKGEKTRRNYDAVLNLISKHSLKDWRTFGTLSLASINPGVADLLYEKLKAKPGGGERTRTAILGMRVAQRAWNVAWRSKPDHIPPENPFAKMGLSYKAKLTRAVTREELMCFVKKADELGEASIGTAAMIAFFWLQRQKDILTRLSWTHYRPADAPSKARIFHHKTGELGSVDIH